MGRPGLSRHPKFLRLARQLGSAPLARGCLELLWEVAYENGDELIGDSDTVEAAAGWRGKKGALTIALLEAGGGVRVGFIRKVDKGFTIHDLWDHAPDYVAKRRKREENRKHLSAERRTMADNGGRLSQNGNTPSPSPSPSPNKEALATSAKKPADALLFVTAAVASPPTPPLVPDAPEAPGTIRQAPGGVGLRLKALTDLMVSDYARLRGTPYKHGGAKDAQALKGLLPIATDDEIRGEWARALALPSTDWHSCSTFAQLASKWNDLAAPIGKRAWR